MTGRQLKDYIVENDRVIDILSHIGMHNIDEKSKYISCSYPDGDNTNGCLVYPSLFITPITRTINNDKGYNPDILDLVSFITKSPSIPYLMDYLGLSNTPLQYSQEKADGLDIFRKVKKRNNKKNKEIKYLEDSVLNRYLSECHISLVHVDGIFPQTAMEWELGIDLDSNRITFAHRDWSTGKLLAVVGRTLVQAYEELKIDKYMTICGKGYIKTANLYGLYKNMKNIKETKTIIIVEGEKSVIKLWQYGYRFAVAVGCHSISKQQLAILSLLGLKEIVVAFDSDVQTSEIFKICKEAKDVCPTVSFIDTSKIKIYSDKCSPVDKGLKRWNLLYKNRKVYKEEDYIDE